MSCNGCRVLRKGCSEGCVLRPCLEWIDGADSQGHATVFVAKFFGRAGLMSFISAVPDSRRPALFQSLLYEACGRTINPVNGAVGLLWGGNWEACRAAVEAVLRGGGGALRPVELEDLAGADELGGTIGSPGRKRKKDLEPECDLDLCLTPRAAEGRKRRPTTPSMNSEGSVTTSGDDSGAGVGPARLLNLFV